MWESDSERLPTASDDASHLTTILLQEVSRDSWSLSLHIANDHVVLQDSYCEVFLNIFDLTFNQYLF